MAKNKNTEQLNLENIDPDNYFQLLKEKKQETSDEFFKNLYENTEVLLKKFHVLGQNKLIRKLLFTLEVLEKEKVLFDKGFRTFIYRDDIEYYIDKVSDKAVQIIELANYPRVIPDEVAEKVVELKKENIFDEYFIVFTDYTGETKREVKKEAMRKDPIIFGVFLKNDSARGKYLHDRFYYIADWEDEYCDLTLSKMVSDMSAKGKIIERKVSDTANASIEDIQSYMEILVEADKTKGMLVIPEKPKKNVIKKVQTWLKHLTEK